MFTQRSKRFSVRSSSLLRKGRIDVALVSFVITNLALVNLAIEGVSRVLVRSRCDFGETMRVAAART